MKIEDTIFNSQWISDNTENLLDCFPMIFGEFEYARINIGHYFKLIGVQWETPEELDRAIDRCELLGMCQRRDIFIRRNPDWPKVNQEQKSN